MKNLSISPGSLQFEKNQPCSDRILIGWMLAIIILRLWLVEVYELMATWTPHDDYLFIKLAKNLLSGEWLGPYNDFTLIKGPVYPLFIAASHWLGLPLLLSQQLLYSGACVLAVYALRPLCRNRYLLMAFFTLLILNPFMYNYPLPGRPLREGFSISLVLIVFSTLLGTITRLNHSLRHAVCWAVGFGTAFTLLWYTREEGIWLLPSVMLCVLIIFMIGREGGGASATRRILMVCIPAGIFIGCSLEFAALNYEHYGEFIINELKSEEFIAAYGGLMNIKPDSFRQFRPVSRDMMEKAYKVSPSFKELEPYFQSSEHEARFPPSFYIWTLRSVVGKAGHKTSLTEALHFYKKIGDELAQACQDGRLPCLDRAPSLQPPWSKSYNRLIVPVFIDIFRQAVGFSNFHAELDKFEKWRSSGGSKIIADYQFVTLDRILPEDRKVVLGYPEYYQHLRKEKVRVLKDIGDSYKILSPILFILAFLAHILLIIKNIWHRQCSLAIIFGVVLLGGLLSLVAILSFVQITLWPINRPLYSAYPVILLYTCFMIGSFVQSCIIEHKKGNTAASSASDTAESVEAVM
jgi:hypothetical protein